MAFEVCVTILVLNKNREHGRFPFPHVPLFLFELRLKKKKDVNYVIQRKLDSSFTKSLEIVVVTGS